MTVEQLIALLQSIGVDTQTVAELLKSYVPSQQVDAIANLAELIVPIVTQLAAKGLAAWSAASGQPITVESVQALMANPTPLTPPTQ